jgi:hypothetical protein
VSGWTAGLRATIAKTWEGRSAVKRVGYLPGTVGRTRQAMDHWQMLPRLLLVRTPQLYTSPSTALACKRKTSSMWIPPLLVRR